jgi:FMN phosphatase YigB (HAD superfamily)
MQIYSLPTRVRAIVFDIDSTLYTNIEYVDAQIELQVRKAAEHWSIPFEEGKTRVQAWRDQYAMHNDGKHQSLGNTLAGLGIPISTSVRWRVETFRPADYLVRDDLLRAALEALSQSFRLIAVTNNPASVGVSTLEVLGVSEFLTEVVGLETTGYSKPSVEPFVEALRRLGTAAGETVSVGDRYDVDMAPALAVGMGGILVDGVTEVHVLPEFLRSQGLLGG